MSLVLAYTDAQEVQVIGIFATVLVAALTGTIPAIVQASRARTEARRATASASAAASSASAAANTASAAADDAANVRHEVHPNGGDSMRDKVDLIAAMVTEIKRTQETQGMQLTAQSRDIGGIRQELRQERAERAELASRVTHIEQQH